MGRRVRLADPQRAGLHDHHRFGRPFEQQAIARLELAHPEIITLQRLLDLQKALLELARLAQIAPEGDAVLAPVDAEHGVADRHVAIARGVVDLPPVLHLSAAGSGEHLHDLGTRFVGDCLNPVAADHGAKAREFARVKGGIENGAGVVEHQVTSPATIASFIAASASSVSNSSAARPNGCLPSIECLRVSMVGDYRRFRSRAAAVSLRFGPARARQAHLWPYRPRNLCRHSGSR